MPGIDEYKGDRVTVKNVANRCIHSRYCVLNLDQVFLPNVDGPWIKPDAASREAVIATVEKCPSGALQYEAPDVKEQPPTVNTVRVWENGPLAFNAELSVAGDKSSFRAVLCRCGQSKNKPYCDHSHVEAKFVATGEPESQDSQPLAVRNGPLEVKPIKDGPLCVTGNLEVCAASGRTITRDSRQFFCRCGHSGDKPFCDGSHKMAHFKAGGTF